MSKIRGSSKLVLGKKEESSKAESKNEVIISNDTSEQQSNNEQPRSKFQQKTKKAIDIATTLSKLGIAQLKHFKNIAKHMAGMLIAQGATKSPLFAKIVKKLDYAVNYLTYDKETIENESEVIKHTHAPSVFGWWVIILSIGSFIIWGMLAPLNSAVPATGQVVFESQKHVIQHAYGGTINKILVKNGQMVKKGDILIELDKVSAASSREQYFIQLMLAKAENARLTSERDELENINFSEDLLKYAGEKIVHDAMKAQERLFQENRKRLASRIEHYNKDIELFSERKKLSLSQLELTEEQITNTRQLVEANQKLLEKGNSTKERLAEYQNRLAEYLSRKSSFLSQITEAEQQISQKQVEIDNFKSNNLAEILKELRQNQERMLTSEETFKDANDRLEKTEIRAPIDGIVNNLLPGKQTEGGTIERSQPVVEIDPINDNLIIEAQVPANNIDVVHVGQTAWVQLAPFKARIVPKLKAKVIFVSSDIATESRMANANPYPMGVQQQPQPFYKARIEIDPKSLEDITKAKGVKILPGMQATVFIEFGNRTFFSYLMDPITTTFGRAFIEK